MQSSKSAAPTETSSAVSTLATTSTPPDLGRGLTTLLHGKGETNLEAPRTTALSGHPIPKPSAPVALQLGLVCADLLLVTQATLLVLGHSPPLDFGITALCALSFGIGAWLTVMAIRLHNR